MIKPGRLVSKTAFAAFDAAAGIIRTVLKVVGMLLLVFLLAGMIFACIFAYYVKTCLTPELDVSLDDYRLDQSSTIWYSDSGGEWHELVTLTGVRNRVWVDYEHLPGARTSEQAVGISPEVKKKMQGSNFNYMELATIAIEDKRFYDHKGVDWYRTSGAFVEMFATMRNSYGGSTITQQLIKNLTGQDEVTVQRKLTEIFGALELEKKYDKQEIMEWYLNAVYFGEGCYGVQTAAEMYFGKDVSELSLAECAAIIGITNLPTYYDPFYNTENNKTRQETILREMYNQGFITYAEYKQAAAEELVFARTPDAEYTQTIYSYYEETVVNDVIHDLMALKGISEPAARTLVFNGGYQIYSCIDTTIQSYVDSVYQDLSQIPDGGGTQQLQSSVVIMNPYDGRIVALSGGVGKKEINFGLNRATGTQRSPGSSFKPIASYGPATELGYITPSTLVNDSPYMVLSGTSWYPENDSKTNIGVVTIFDALTYSLNTVAAQIVDKLTPETCYNYLVNKLGVTSLVPDDCSYAPMALGQLTNGITVREMAAAYCSFVNDGIFTYSRTYSLVTDKDGNVVINNMPNTIEAFSPNTAHTITYMLENAVENGTGTEATLYNMPVAGKTGTSGDYYDRWFVGCTPYYVAAVWTGFDTPARINSGGNPAARLWRSVMKPVHDPLEYRSFTYPYLGEDTGIFGITGFTDTGINMDDSIFLPESGDIFLDGGYVGGPLTQPDIFVSGNTDNFNFSGNDSGTVVIFG
ncbi:MAG: transglycosylase domain-containing protein [Eubacteriales bacterium]|nr:transglycosylase domain-containing protein [Eubacteriales bacterium]